MINLNSIRRYQKTLHNDLTLAWRQYTVESNGSNRPHNNGRRIHYVNGSMSVRVKPLDNDINNRWLEGLADED